MEISRICVSSAGGSSLEARVLLFWKAKTPERGREENPMSDKFADFPTITTPPNDPVRWEADYRERTLAFFEQQARRRDEAWDRENQRYAELAGRSTTGK